MKQEHAIFEFVPKNDIQLKYRIEQLIQNPDFIAFVTENEGKKIRVDLKVVSDYLEKAAMYDYYYGPLMEVIIRLLTHLGWSGIDKNSADYILKKRFFSDKKVTHPDGTVEFFPSNKSNSEISKQRLRKYVEDVVNWIEIEHGWKAPDSASWKQKLITGRNMVPMKSRKINPNTDF